MSSTMEKMWEESGGVHCTFPACMCLYGSSDESLRNTPVSHVAPPLLSHDFTPQRVSWHDDRARASSPLPSPSLWPRLTKERVFFFFYCEWHTVDIQMNQLNVTQNFFFLCCFSRDVTADVTRKCDLAFWKRIGWFLITLSCKHTDLIRPWFLFLSTPPNLPDTPGSTQAFSWKDYRCVQLTTMHFGGNEHVEDNPKKSVSRWILWVKSSQFYLYHPETSSLIPLQGQRDIQTNSRPTTQI